VSEKEVVSVVLERARARVVFEREVICMMM
jgi:hypothetical protein